MTTVKQQAEGSSEPSAPAVRPSARRLVDVALSIAAIGGVLCIGLVIAASVFHITLIMFKTGSMSPTIPAGSLAVVKQIPASEARVGDVVTISRPGELPITHRVTSAAPQGDLVSITMRGDANDFEDPEPYLVDSVRIVLYSVPGLASMVISMSHPLVLGGITLGAAVLVGWAFWPRGPGHDPGGDDRRDDRKRRSDRRSGHGRRSARRGVTTGAAMLIAVVTIAPILAAPTPAHAGDIEITVRGRYLTLVAIGNPDEMDSLSPTRPAPWQVGVTVAPPEPGVVNIGLSAVGDLTDPGELALDVRACAERWVAGVCSSGASMWLPRQDLAAAVLPIPASMANPYGAREIGEIGMETVWLMLRVVLQGTTQPGSALNLRLHAWGGGESVVIGDPVGGAGSDTAIAAAAAAAGSGSLLGRSGTGGLAFTGFGGEWPFALAVLAVSLGLAFAGAARLRRSPRG